MVVVAAVGAVVAADADRKSPSASHDIIRTADPGSRPPSPPARFARKLTPLPAAGAFVAMPRQMATRPKRPVMGEAMGSGVVVLGIGIYAGIWLFVLVGSQFFGPK